MCRNNIQMEERMSKKREFGEGPIFTITNYIWWFFLGSFYFLLLNIPLIITLMAITYDPSGAVVLLLLSSIPVGPAAAALFSAMGKLVRTKDVDITKDFFKAYKTNFVQSLIVWLMELAFFFLMYCDIKFFSVHMPALRYFFYILSLIVFNTGLYAFPIISRFYMKTKDIIKLSFYCSMKYIKVTIFNISIIIISGYIVFKIPSILVIFMISILCYGIMYVEKDALKDIEDKLQPKQETYIDEEAEDDNIQKDE